MMMTQSSQKNIVITTLIVVCIAVGTLGAVWGGPALGDHETIVAQCARNMRLTGDWLVPYYLGDAYVRKPPLPYWMIAGLSYLFPNDPQTGLPVTTLVARLPSALAAFGTVLLLWKLASSMFGQIVGRTTAVVAASGLFFLLYAANATVEMILTFCCTWAHVHFWFATQAPARSSRRKRHLFFFFLAMGVGMLAKGPFPLVMVAMPIIFWWYTQRPFRVIASSGGRAWRSALTRFFRELWPRTREAFSSYYLIPGLIVFGLCFVPWMIAVGIKHPDSWDLWNWQYWQRAQGQYDDTRPRNFFYYLPVMGGLILPWMFLVFEAAASPWMRKYARQRRGLLYAGLWTLVGFLVMSLMTFKKPYYIGPVIPPLSLLLGVVAARFYSQPFPKPHWTPWLKIAVILGGIGFVGGGYLYLREEFPQAAVALTVIAAVAVAALILACLLYFKGRRWTAFGLTAASSILAFHAVWYGCGTIIDNIDKVADLERVLNEQGISKDTPILWVHDRPDGRLSFYFARCPRPMIQPEEIVTKFVDRTTQKDTLKNLVIERTEQLISSPKPVYLVLDREEYDLARMFGFATNACVIGEIKDSGRPGKDWILLANPAVKEHPN
ncbi:MAG: hypothetical protein GX629_01605 [Phycisphaerae bacterium]|jgi:4-amino-4-deoxy-L-arabinose transferase-like glycosyltransferase|nr:hypothetical protein [Phycisphaerae bacterium]